MPAQRCPSSLSMSVGTSIKSNPDFFGVHRIESDRNEKFGIVPSLIHNFLSNLLNKQADTLTNQQAWKHLLLGRGKKKSIHITLKIIIIIMIIIIIIKRLVNQVGHSAAL